MDDSELDTTGDDPYLWDDEDSRTHGAASPSLSGSFSALAGFILIAGALWLLA